MKVRAALILALILAVLLLTLPAGEAQRAGKRTPLIGYLSGGSESPRDVAFRQGLLDLGYIAGQNIAIEHRFADGKFERLPDLAAELVRLNVAVIVSSSTPAASAAQQATRTIPIVMVAFSGQPEEAGAVSPARPSGNITGLTTMSADVSGKRLELLKETLKRLSRVAVLRNPDNALSAAQLTETEMAARSLGLQTQFVEARGPHEFERAFEAASRGRADAVIGLPDTMFVVYGKRLAQAAADRRLPTMYEARELPEAGSLMSYGPNVSDMHRRAAMYVDKILRGAKPGDLPIEQPTKFELVINLKTARALGLTIPSSLLLRADQIIE